MPITDRPFYRTSDVDLDDFRRLIEVDPIDYPFAADVRRGVPVYRADTIVNGDRVSILGELAEVLLDGPGIYVIAGAMPADLIDRTSDAFERIIAAERAAGNTRGDHYAKPGANDRVWNAIEKFAVADPAAWVGYHANEAIALAATAWLGPHYQLSTQVNVVNPGGEAQQPHRDYHLGFMTDDEAERFPAHVHHLSPVITLQGAVAHCDMPVETGPTMYLPHSQKYPPGYLAWRRREFVDYFAEHHTQLPLEKGDMVFFNPALFHAAGTNRTTDVRRMANLLQISSALARTMETVDRIRIAKSVYPELLTADLSPPELEAALTAAAEGYAFPTNLDHDPPVEGLTPPSHRDILAHALAERLPPEQLNTRLDALARRRASI